VTDEPTSATAGRVVVLLSGAGSLFQALLDAARRPEGPRIKVRAAISDRADAPGLERARAAGVPTAVVSPDDFPDRPSWDAAVARAVDVFSPDLVVLAGFMRVLGAQYLARYGGRTITAHPALLPAFPGAHAVRDALDYGVRVTGCSLILVDAGTDTGPVVAQRAVEVLDGDDEASLHERIKVVEREMLVDVVARMLGRGWSVDGRRVKLG
jgi:phosphoribosylglycinamide formyltransferase-1